MSSLSGRRRERPGRAGDPAVPTGTGPRRRGPGGWQVTGLLRAAHPVQGVLTAAGAAALALAWGRPPKEAAMVLATVLVGQLVLAWHDDLVDQEYDARHRAPGRPLAEGWLSRDNAWYAVAVGVLALVPLSFFHGVVAGACYLAAVAVGVTGDATLRRTPLSWLPWAVSWSLAGWFVAAGGWAGTGRDVAPESLPLVLLAGLGACVHVLRSLPGLVDDDADGWRSLPLVVARRTGATALLVLAGAAALALAAAVLLVGPPAGTGG